MADIVGTAAPTIPTRKENLFGVAENAAVILTTAPTTYAGDLLLALQGADYYAETLLVAPTGSGISTWTQVALGDRGTNNVHVKAWVATCTADGAKVVTFGQVSDAVNHAHLYVLPGGLSAIGAGGSGSGTAQDAPTVTPPAVNTLLIAAWVAKVVGDYTAPGSMAERGESDWPPWSTMSSATEQLTAATATGVRTATFSSSTNFAAVSVAVTGRAGPSGTGTLTGSGGRRGSGTITGTGTVTSSGKANRAGTGTLSAVLGLTDSGRTGRAGTGSCSGTSSASSSSGTAGRRGTATTSSTGTVSSANGRSDRGGTAAALTATGSGTGSGTAESGTEHSGAIAAVLDAAGSGQSTRTGAATAPLTTTLSAAAAGRKNVAAAASVTATGSTTATGAARRVGAGSLAAAATAAAAGVRGSAGAAAAAVSGTSSCTAGGAAKHAAGTGVLTAVGVLTAPLTGDAELDAVGALTGSGRVGSGHAPGHLVPSRTIVLPGLVATSTPASSGLHASQGA